MSPPSLRPLRVGEILDASIKVYLKNARVLIRLAAMVVVPIQVLSAVILLSTVSAGNEVPSSLPTFKLGTSSTSRGLHTASLGASVITAILGGVASLLVTAACVKTVSDTFLDLPTGIGESLRSALSRVRSLIWMYVLYVVCLAFAFVALLIPGIWLYAAWSVATPALLIERKHAAEALKRSAHLVRGRWWPTAGVLLVSTLITSVVGGAFSAVLIGFLLSGSHTVAVTVIVSSAASAVAAILTRPFQATVVTILYYDLRVRREGYDVELLAEQLGIEQTSLPPSALMPSTGTYVGSGPESVGKPGGPPFWPPPPGWVPARPDGEQY
jgi:hypothetical protein